MPDTSADRFFSVQPEMIELNAGTFSNPGGRLVFQRSRCGTPSWFVQIPNQAMLLLFDNYQEQMLNSILVITFKK
jgi:hypothetical protein